MTYKVVFWLVLFSLFCWGKKLGNFKKNLIGAVFFPLKTKLVSKTGLNRLGPLFRRGKDKGLKALYVCLFSFNLFILSTILWCEFYEQIRLCRKRESRRLRSPYLMVRSSKSSSLIQMVSLSNHIVDICCVQDCNLSKSHLSWVKGVRILDKHAGITGITQRFMNKMTGSIWYVEKLIERLNTVLNGMPYFEDGRSFADKHRESSLRCILIMHYGSQSAFPLLCY